MVRELAVTTACKKVCKGKMRPTPASTDPRMKRARQVAGAFGQLRKVSISFGGGRAFALNPRPRRREHSLRPGDLARHGIHQANKPFGSIRPTMI